ncbi:MAG: thermonuclease family protein [Minisyncoccia bacterium]
MKKRLITVTILVFLALAVQSWLKSQDEIGFSVVQPKSPAVMTAEITLLKHGYNRVTRVVDGDTIVVDVNGVSEKVRLIGVDTPETVDPRKLVQCFGKEASAFTKSLLLNAPIRLEADSSQYDHDKYGRLLRYVFLEDGTLINEKIIFLGYGHEYTYRIPYKYQAEFKDAERVAREAQKGLWAPEVCKNS